MSRLIGQTIAFCRLPKSSLSLLHRLAAYRTELLFALAGLACLLYAAAGRWRFERFQAQHAAAFAAPLPVSARPVKPPGKQPRLGEPIGHLIIPRLHLSTVLVEGDDDNSLGYGAGRDVDSAPIGAPGNTVLAGHRDAAFWPLRNLKVGDRIHITNGTRYSYIVRSFTVVEPSDTSLLQPSHDSLLTLVTCYPFRYVGPAPKRLIIRAALVS